MLQILNSVTFCWKSASQGQSEQSKREYFSIVFSRHYFRDIKQGDPAKGKGDNQQQVTEFLIMADDEGLEAIRQKRLAELQGQQGDFAVQSLFLFNYNQAKILSVQFGYC